MSICTTKKESTSQPSQNEVIDEPSKDKPTKRRKRKKRIKYKKFMKSLLKPKMKKKKPFSLPKAVHFKKVDHI
jgi:hypothetical protein